MRSGTMKVGTLAKKTGLTVRTLHYYEEIGLLAPAYRSEAGYRLYGADEVARLQQILSLRQLGFSLEAIRECLDQPAFSPHRVIQLHLASLQEQIELQQRLKQRLEILAAYLRSAEEIPVEQFIHTIERITMLDNYYSKEQLEALKARAQELGEEGLRTAEAQWKALIEQVHTEMAKGTDPASEPVQHLARRWQAMVQAFTGDDPGITQSLQTMYAQEGPAKASRGMVDADVWAYISKAMAALS